MTVDHLTRLLVAQTRGDVKAIRRQVKAELEQRTDAGLLRRWEDVHGPSARP